MPAYSQSTIRSRSPSSMKFAFSRSLWQGATGRDPSARSIRPASSFACAKASGTRPPRSLAVFAYVSTTRKESNVVGSDAPTWNGFSAATTRAIPSGVRIRSGGTGSPATKRVTSTPSGSRNATTSGPTPAAAAASAAACSARRSIPSNSVSLPPIRRTYASPSTDTLKLWFVMPPPSGTMRGDPSGQSRAATVSGCMRSRVARRC